MDLMVGVISFLLKICWAFVIFLVLQGSADVAKSPSPVTYDAISPVEEGNPVQIPQRKQMGNISPSPSSQSNGSSFNAPIVSPPVNLPPAPEAAKGLAPALAPSTPTVLPPNKSPPTTFQGITPSLPPSASQTQPPPVETPILVPEAAKGLASALAPSTPTVLPPNKSPPTTFQGITPSLPPSASQILPPPVETPILVPEAAKGLAPALAPSTPTVLPPNKSPPTTFQGITPSLPPSASQTQPPPVETPILVPEAPVPVVSPSGKLPDIHPVMPGSVPPSSQHSKAPDTKAPLSTPTAPVQISPPPRDMPQKPPTSQPVLPEVPPSNLPVPAALPPHNLPVNSPPTKPALPELPPSNLPVPAASPPSNLPSYLPPVHPVMPEVPPSNMSEPEVSPIYNAPPSINRKRDRVPVFSPSYVMPKHLPPPDNSPAATTNHSSQRNGDHAPPPLPIIKAPSHAVDHSPTPLPATSFKGNHHARKNITSPPPVSYLVPPPPLASADRDPANAQPPSRPPKKDLKQGPVSTDPPAQAMPSRQTRMPSLSPKISPSGSTPKMPHLQPIHTLPPPPPNEECTPLLCNEPFTNTLPGSPCSCILPMQVGLRLSVALYTFFPLVSEFATEIAAGVFLKQSQVRIMGANADSQDPDKTIVLMDLVPFGDEFDNTTAYFTYQRFWRKQVPISTSLFGDYEVLYVHYTGLPDSPPSAPSTVNPGPRDNNGRTIKPVGVDVSRGQRKKGLKGSVVAVIVLSASVAVILLCAIAWVLLFRHRDRDIQVEKNPPAKLPSLAKSSGIAASMTGSGPSSISLSYNSTVAPYTGTAKTFTLSDMKRTTDNFDSSRILGEGGFGLVYSGVLEDGTEVAVKVLKRDDQQGDREFLAEVEMLSRLHHRNLVKLIGICTEEHARCLVYELIPNGSVESHLHGVDKEDAPLDWGARLKIALGAARGLAYLHEDSSPRVIHRDFKSSNILLEHDFTPKVSDFGLARSALDEDNTHISTRVMGTFGYVAPEYAMTGHLLVKSDVYSYGVVLLELLTGRKPVDMSQPPGQENLVTWSRPLLTSEEGLELIVDKSLGPDFPFDSISKVAAISSMCVQPEVSHRPFMGEVVQALKLVCNECNATKDLGSRCGSQEDLLVDFEDRSGTHSGRLPDPLQILSPVSDYESALTAERGLPLSELFDSSARIGKTDSGSFRRHSSSGPLRSESVLPLWQRTRRMSGGSVSEHGAMFRLWHGHH